MPELAAERLRQADEQHSRLVKDMPADDIAILERHLVDAKARIERMLKQDMEDWSEEERMLSEPCCLNRLRFVSSERVYFQKTSTRTSWIASQMRSASRCPHFSLSQVSVLACAAICS